MASILNQPHPVLPWRYGDAAVFGIGMFNEEFNFDKQTNIQKFIRFHRMYPAVYELFCKFTVQLIRNGFKHNSAYAVMHRIRWETSVNPNRDFEGFKISNGLIPYYARMWLDKNPEHKYFFHTRELIVR